MKIATKTGKLGLQKLRLHIKIRQNERKYPTLAVFGSNFPLIKEVDNFMVC